MQPWLGDVLTHTAIAHLQLDSRVVSANDVFFALAGEQAMAAHIAQAIAQGAAAVVVDQEKQFSVSSAVPLIAVENLKAKLGAIASAFYGEPSLRCKVIGVTGTNGKTSCSHWLAQAWQQVSGDAAIIGTLGCGMIAHAYRDETGMTTPDVLTVQHLLANFVQQGAQMVAMEVSSHALSQQRVDHVQFASAIFTNLTRDHLDYHGTMENYAAEKQKLFDVASLQFAVINADDAFGQQLIQHMQRAGKTVFGYALESKTSELGVERYEVTGQGIAASIRTPWGRVSYTAGSRGYNLLNALAVVATLCGHGMRLDAVLHAVAQLQAVPGRTHIVSEQSDEILVVVDYAHTPDALQKILQALRPQTTEKLWCVFGCGGNRDAGKRSQMAQVAQAFADEVVVTSDNPRNERSENIIADIVAGFSASAGSLSRHRVIVDRAEAIAYAVRNAARGDVVLLAGKGHENYQEVLGVRLPFSDIEQAQSQLQQRRLQNAEVRA
ncbi:MAG: UDP-N-acetylmuramoyl-L-alanyl-D-glutamate--2,6-diaminopimelate ligase [Pseudomonadales bacterium]